MMGDDLLQRIRAIVSEQLGVDASEVNAEHLLYFDKIVLTEGAMETLAKRTTA